MDQMILLKFKDQSIIFNNKKIELHLLQSAVLSQGPIGHYTSSNQKKQVTSHRLRSNIEPKPLVNLRCVVCACHDVKQEAVRDLITSIAIRISKVLQNNMAVKV